MITRPAPVAKTCARCRETKPASDFRANAKLRDGLDSWCRDCHRDHVRASRAVHGWKYNAARRGTVRSKPGPWRAVQLEPLAKPYLEAVSLDPCAYCGAPASASRELDHIQSTAAGGKDEWDNFAATCRPCNNLKGDRPLLEFLLEKNGTTKVAEAISWLKRELADGRWHGNSELATAATAAGISGRSLRLATESSSIALEHRRPAPGSRAAWRLPTG